MPLPFVTSRLIVSAVACLGAAASAQNIERVKLTDNDLNCAQIYAEAQQMDTMAQLSASMPASYSPPATPAYPQPAPAVAVPAVPSFPIAAQNNFAFQGAVMADPNVRASIARARAAGMSDAQISATLGVGMQRAGLPQMPVAIGAANGAMGGIAGMFGALNSSAQAQQQPPVQAPMQGAMPVGQAAPKASTAMQAQARKEHLTGMFLSRNCKLADVQK